MLRNHNILCVSSIDWTEHWQIHQELMSRLADAGNRVLYIENTGVRRPGIADLSRVRRRLLNWWRSTKGFREERPNLFVYSPLFLPFPYSRVAGWINRVLLFRALDRWMQATGFTRPIVWTFLPTPLARSLIAQVSPAAVIYYCADDFSSSSAAATRVTASEAQLIKEADLVFTTSERLRERAASHGGRVHRFPAGVNFDAFARVREADGAPPGDVARLSKPIIGYIGALHQWLDQALVATLAARLPDMSFVIVGPPYSDVSRLRECGNVHLLGERPHEDVPRYVKAFDVGLVPYRISDYTDSVYPVKLNEYLAMGIPVVATDLPEIRRFNAEHGDVIAVAPDAEHFAAAIADALGPADNGVTERRIAAARQNSWTGRVAAMSELVEQVLAEKQARGDSWDRRLTRLYRVARRRTTQAVVAVVAAYLLIFETPLVFWMASPLKIAEPPQAADAIVVFAGGVGESGQAGGGYQERVAAAVDLYKSGYARSLVFSSGFRFVFHEAEVMRDLAVVNGVPPDAIVLEQAAANTHENVQFSAAILRQHGWRKILLVSSPYHMRRALLTWRKAVPDVTVVPTPVARSLFYLRDGRGPTLDQIRGIAQEYAAIVVYRGRGWI
jgi:uncharacterized SAM-binding protein YcdF (DUF218 family)/glycosyltransferase involved in cell wall biosynthesis